VDEPIKEFRLAHKLAQQVGLGTFAAADPPGRWKVGHDLSNNANFRTGRYGDALYAAMGRTATSSFQQGLDLRFTVAGAFGGTLELTPEATKPGRRAAPDQLRVTPGWEVQYLTSKDRRRFLCYVRNIAGGIVPIQQRPDAGYTRSPRAAPLAIECGVPLGTGSVAIVDLDTGEERAYPYGAAASIDLGVTDHDYAIVASPK